jgi:phage tail sheath gpL-like
MIDRTMKAGATGISHQYIDQRKNKTTYLPQKIAVVAQGETAANSSYTTEPWSVTSYGETATKYGSRSPIAHMVRKLKPPGGGGVGGVEVTVYPMKDHAGGVAATGSITPSGTLTADAYLKLRIGGEESATFKVAKGAVSAAAVVPAMLAACAENPNIPALTSGTTVLAVAAAWEGTTGNASSGFKIEVLGNTQGGVFTIAPMTGGLNNPDVTPAVAQIGPRWETLIINQMEPSDGTTLDKYVAWGEPRWGSLQHCFAVVVTGSTESVRATITAITDGRKTDRTNLIWSAEGSPTLPFVCAAALVATIAPEMNNHPASDFGLLPVVGVIPGATAVQFDPESRDFCVKKGLSTSEYRDNQIVVGDLVTCYHPTGEDPPPYASLCDINKLMNFGNLLKTEFDHRRWRGVAIVADDQSTDEPRARRRKDVLAACYKVVNAGARMAIVANPKFINANITCNIDPGNPKRLNTFIPPPLSSNMNIHDIAVGFSFFFGEAA